MRDRAIGVEAGVWSVPDARKLARMRPRPRLLRILVEVPDMPGPLALAEAAMMTETLALGGLDAPILLHGENRSAWPCLQDAIRRGFDTRIGFEDVTCLPDGRPARSNAELVAAARALVDHPDGGARA